jgi:aminopeptidase
VPSPAWAKKVFPGETEEVAMAKLWEAIRKTVYLEGDPVANWNQHIAQSHEKSSWLNQQKFVSLEYRSANGTNFTVGLIPQALWCEARDTNIHNGVQFTPNMPTEEVFTSPMAGKAEGVLVATKPLSWQGQLIENFSVTFQGGKAVDCKAEKGEEALRQMIAMDETSCLLGEVALVPKESPVNQTGLLFYNTLFDENACCHVALGRGFTEVLEGFSGSPEEAAKQGVNDSLIHVDFMIGSDDLEITGVRADGSRAVVFTNGTWAKH